MPTAPRFPAVLFDFDGTLTHPDALDFPALRTALDCPPGTLILEFIDALPSEAERQAKRRILWDFERAAARASVPNEGAEDLVARLKRAGVVLGILTRNTRSSVLASLDNFRAVREGDFRVIVTRESGGRPKPHPDGVLVAARDLGVRPRDLLVVGDFVFDIAAGKAAGAATVLLTNGRNPDQMRPVGAAAALEAAPDYTIRRLEELAAILGLPSG
jgi:hydrogenase expression/formation protein HypE